MIQGMTGFGSTQVSIKGTKIIVELKSVNHRYLDLSYNMPSGLNTMESKIRQMIQPHIQRGRVTISVKVFQKPAKKVVLNKEIIRKYLKQAESINKEFDLDNDLTLSHLVTLPGVVELEDQGHDPEEMSRGVEKGVRLALKSLLQMRKSEGRSVAQDIASRVSRMSAQIKIIEKQAIRILKDKRNTLSTEEFVSFQKGNDVSEEITRMKHYFVQIKGLLKDGSSVGKKIDFVAQEMQRETNTIGSKLQDKIVSNAVITLKSKIEKIREQAQNIE